MKRLYISDLDGTLLNEQAMVSDSCKKELEKILSSGISFTCATARTPKSVVHILGELNFTLPIIMMNGTIIYDFNSHEYVKVEYLNASANEAILLKMKELGLTSFMFGIKDNEFYAYYENLYNDVMVSIHEERVRLYQKKYTQVASFLDVPNDHIIYHWFMDKKEVLDPLYDWLTAHKKEFGLEVCYYPDNYYKEDYCLEVLSENATKYNAALWIKQQYDFDYLIGFGDNLNDLFLTKACDETYAVANAHEQLKEAVTGIIGSNLENGVTHYIMNREHITL